MVAKRQQDSNAAKIREWLKAHPRSTTGEIAQAVGWTSGRVSATMWSEMRRTPQVIIREEQVVPGRTAPRYVYLHRDTLAHAIISPAPAFVVEPAVAGPRPRDEQPKVQPPVRVTYGDLTDVIMPPGVANTTPHEPGLGAVVEELARAIAQHVLSRVEAQLAEQLKHILPETTQPLKPISVEALTRQILPQEHTGPRRPTILIAGLLPNQAGIIQTEFGEAFDFRFYMVGQSMGQLKNMLPGADYVWTFTSKISHAVEETMKAKGVTIHRCSGGLTMLKDQLLALYVRITDKKDAT